MRRALTGWCRLGVPAGDKGTSEIGANRIGQGSSRRNKPRGVRMQRLATVERRVSYGSSRSREHGFGRWSRSKGRPRRDRACTGRRRIEAGEGNSLIDPPWLWWREPHGARWQGHRLQPMARSAATATPEAGGPSRLRKACERHAARSRCQEMGPSGPFPHASNFHEGRPGQPVSALVLFCGLIFGR